MPHGRTEDFTRFAHDSYDELLRMAYLICARDRTLAEDLLQTALLKTYLHWNRIDDKSRARSYVRATMINDFVRTTRRAIPVSSDSINVLADHTQTDDSYRLADLRMDLATALSHLPPRQRVAVVLRYYIGLSERQSASEFSCSLAAIKSLAVRGLNGLNAELDPKKEDAHE
ncbi:MAG: sigma-70 family RNA polymerase sigma factor [Mycobacteriales bacterium]